MKDWISCRFARTALALWLITIISYGYIHQRHFDNAMAISRLDLLHSLVSHGTFSIDAYGTNTNDKAVVSGHYYCDKAPGSVVLALPSFYLSSKILSVFGISVESQRGWFLSSWICVVASAGLITSLGVACLYRWLRGFMPCRYALAACLVIALGSMAFPYATMLMSHAMVVGLFSIALCCLRLGWNHSEPQDPSGNKRLVDRDLIAGASCGMAIASEYSSALVAGGILAAVAFSGRRRARNVIVGALPFLFLIPVYDWICTGNPFSLPYSHEAVFTQNHSGFYGIHLPNVNNLFQLLFSAKQGLFFWTPFLLLAFVGYPVLYRETRTVFWLCYFVPLIQVLIMSGYYTMTAGETLGSRFLAPILPLLILPAGIGATKIPRMAMFLAVVSVAMTGGATLVDACLPSGDGNPFFNYYVPQLLAGNFTHNIGEAAGLKGFWSIAPLLAAILGGAWYLWRQCIPDFGRTGSPAGSAVRADKIL